MAFDFSKLTRDAKETEAWLSRELAGVRTGRASPALLDFVKPEVYGARTPLAQLASISIEDARTLRVIPWDKAIAKDIERGIAEADLGISTAVDDAGLRIIFPELTTERRGILGKLVGEKLEQARVTLRSHRTDTLHALEQAEKEGGMGKDECERLKKELQKMIDATVEKLEALEKKKLDEIAQ